MQNKRNTNKSNERTKSNVKSPNSPILNIVKLPSLPKVSSPQLTKKFFNKKEEEIKKANLSERKSTQSLYNFSFNKISDELHAKRKSDENLKFKHLEPRLAENSVESVNGSNLNYVFHTIQEINDETLNDRLSGRSHASSSSRKNTERETGKEELDRKSRQKTIKNETDQLEKELEHLRRVLKIEQDKYTELEAKHRKTKENKLRLSDLLKDLEDKSSNYEKALKNNQALRAKIEELEDRVQLNYSLSQKNIAAIEEELSLKTGEIENLNLLLKKSDAAKNRYAESVNNLEQEIDKIKSENSRFSNLLQQANYDISLSKSLFLQEKNKVQVLELTSGKVESLSQQKNDLEDQVFELKKKKQLFFTRIKRNQDLVFKLQGEVAGKKEEIKRPELSFEGQDQ